MHPSVVYLLLIAADLAFSDRELQFRTPLCLCLALRPRGAHAGHRDLSVAIRTLGATLRALCDGGAKHLRGRDRGRGPFAANLRSAVDPAAPPSPRLPLHFYMQCAILIPVEETRETPRDHARIDLLAWCTGEVTIGDVQRDPPRHETGLFVGKGPFRCSEGDQWFGHLFLPLDNRQELRDIDSCRLARGKGDRTRW